MTDVRVVAAECENCGTLSSGSLSNKASEAQPFPMTASAEWARSGELGCSRCGSQVRIATEPVAPTPAEAQRA